MKCSLKCISRHLSEMLGTLIPQENSMSLYLITFCVIDGNIYFQVKLCSQRIIFVISNLSQCNKIGTTIIFTVLVLKYNIDGKSDTYTCINQTLFCSSIFRPTASCNMRDRNTSHVILLASDLMQ